MHSPSFSQTLDPATAVDCTLSCDFDVQESPLVSVNVLPEVVNEVCLASTTELGGTRRSCPITPQSSPHMLGKTGPKRIRMISPPRPTSPQFSTSQQFPIHQHIYMVICKNLYYIHIHYSHLHHKPHHLQQTHLSLMLTWPIPFLKIGQK